MDKVNALVKEPWDTLGLYHLDNQQVAALLAHNGIVAEEGWLPARYQFPSHAHHEPQLLLVTRGKLTHVSGKINYTQGPGDILIVPANVKHMAFVGDEELEFYLVLRK